MNIKMFLTVTLLGVSLYLGGSSVIYAESAENVTENFEDSFSDCDLEPEMEEDETGFYGGTDEGGVFLADDFPAILKRSQKKLRLHLYLLVMNSRFWRLFPKTLQ